MQLSNTQMRILFQYLDSLDRYGPRQMRTSFDKQNETVSRKMSTNMLDMCDIYKINKPLAYDLSEKIFTTLDLMKWSYLVPVKRYVDRQNQVVGSVVNRKDVDKNALSKRLNCNIDDRGFNEEEADLEKRIIGIIVDRVNYLLASSNINNQNYVHFKTQIESAIESEAEIYISKLGESSKEIFQTIKKKIRSATDMVIYNVASFVDINKKIT